jgi:hypothetical protein
VDGLFGRGAEVMNYHSQKTAPDAHIAITIGSCEVSGNFALDSSYNS